MTDTTFESSTWEGTILNQKWEKERENNMLSSHITGFEITLSAHMETSKQKYRHLHYITHT